MKDNLNFHFFQLVLSYTYLWDFEYVSITERELLEKRVSELKLDILINKIKL